MRSWSHVEVFSLLCKIHILKGRGGFQHIFSISFSLKCDLNQLDYRKRDLKRKTCVVWVSWSNSMRRGSVLFHAEDAQKGSKRWPSCAKVIFQFQYTRAPTQALCFICSSMCVEESNLNKERNKIVSNPLILSWRDHQGHEDTDRTGWQPIGHWLHRGFWSVGGNWSENMATSCRAQHRDESWPLSSSSGW